MPNWNAIKRNSEDIAFSNYIRQRAGYRCEYCHKLCKVNGEWIARLDASHYIGRGKWSVRYDIENVRSLCSGCHKRMGGYQRDENGEYDLWMKGLLGEKGYRNLVIRANTSSEQSKDRKLIKWYIKQLQSEFKVQDN